MRYLGHPLAGPACQESSDSAVDPAIRNLNFEKQAYGGLY